MAEGVSTRLRAHSYLLLHSATGSGLRRHYRSYLAQDRARSYEDPGSMLKAILEAAVADVPYYRDVVPPGALRGDPLEALAAFPLLTKEIIRREGGRMLSERGDPRRWTRNTSGGSTGEPVVLFQDADHLARTVAIRNVYSTWAGGGLGAPELYIWGSERDILEGGESLRLRIGNRLLRRFVLNAFTLTEPEMARVLDAVRNGSPKLIIAYAQAAYEVARFAEREGIEVPPQRGVIATAGTVHAFIRDQLDSTFGCRTLNRYGSREIGDMAGECSYRDGLHVLPWCSHIEILGEDERPVPPGAEGEIVVTGLTNRAMPLIRYRIGDRAVRGAEDQQCRCGRRTQMLAAVTGREVDMFIASDGTRVDGEYFTHLLYFRPWLRKFQVVQTAPDEVVFRVVPSSGIPPADEEEIAEKARAVLGRGATVRMEEVDAIPPEPSGKLRYTIRAF